MGLRHNILVAASLLDALGGQGEAQQNKDCALRRGRNSPVVNNAYQKLGHSTQYIIVCA